VRILSAERKSGRWHCNGTHHRCDHDAGTISPLVATASASPGPRLLIVPCRRYLSKASESRTLHDNTFKMVRDRDRQTETSIIRSRKVRSARRQPQSTNEERMREVGLGFVAMGIISFIDGGRGLTAQNEEYCTRYRIKCTETKKFYFRKGVAVQGVSQDRIRFGIIKGDNNTR
jgi:hypothetical protein